MDHSSNPQKNNIAWPDLPTSGFLAGRVATQEDVDQERAVFGFPQKLDSSQVSKLTGVDGSEAVECAGSAPLDILIPQYAVLNKDGQKHPCIIIQGEEAEGSKIVACKLVEGGTITIGLLEDFEMLGQKKP